MSSQNWHPVVSSVTEQANREKVSDKGSQAGWKVVGKLVFEWGGSIPIQPKCQFVWHVLQPLCVGQRSAGKVHMFPKNSFRGLCSHVNP